MQKISFFIVATTSVLILSITGCSSMLPVAKSNRYSPWESFEQAKAAFDKITPFQTTVNDLSAIGYDPYKTPNIKIHNYLDIIERFMPNATITKDDLDNGLRACIEATDACLAYEVELHKLQSKRYGSVFLDLFRFKRKAHKTGWRFSALVVIMDDIVVYKIWEGTPKLDEDEYKKNPLGILQDPADVATDAAVIGTF